MELPDAGGVDFFVQVRDFGEAGLEASPVLCQVQGHGAILPARGRRAARAKVIK